MTDTERLAALLIEVFPAANRNQWPFAAMDVAAALVASGVRVMDDQTPVDMSDYMAGYRQAQADGLDVECVAAFLHDEYGCRITCRGGRLADDRHPSHNEAYRGQAERLVAAARVGIDPDRLARALEAFPGPWPPNWTTETLAAAIAKAYEEEG